MDDMRRWIDLVGALGIGGALIVLIQRLWPSKDATVQARVDSARNQHNAEATFRDDLMGGIDSLRDRLNKVESELSDWRDKYTTLLAAHVALQQEYQALRTRYETMQIEVEHLRELCERIGLTS